MKVFVSWSGPRSHAVAQVLREWVMAVIQAARPWLSSEDIQRGAQWFGDIGSQLQESSVGIFCLTQRNKNAPWILFEAGAIAKGVPTNRICTLLIDLEPSDVLGPLSQFNHTQPTRDDMLKLAATLNSALGDARLTDSQLRKSFDAHWQSFETEFARALAEHPEVEGEAPSPEPAEMLGEILSSIRSMNSRLSRIERSSADLTTLERLSSNGRFVLGDAIADNLKPVFQRKHGGADMYSELARLSDSEKKELWHLLAQWSKFQGGKDGAGDESPPVTQ